mmetsp:Transcript_52419/g.162731  ORF Transcript_52419/g.162731 Transcript_52419/m.162731 type:complete len:203 (-) Transcript_52419:760-1368(-)
MWRLPWRAWPRRWAPCVAPSSTYRTTSASAPCGSGTRSSGARSAISSTWSSTPCFGAGCRLLPAAASTTPTCRSPSPTAPAPATASAAPSSRARPRRSRRSPTPRRPWGACGASGAPPPLGSCCSTPWRWRPCTGPSGPTASRPSRGTWASGLRVVPRMPCPPPRRRCRLTRAARCRKLWRRRAPPRARRRLHAPFAPLRSA